ncbi:MAG: hypothetical protein ACTSWE_15225 [Promethearchaeota archaeon]
MFLNPFDERSDDGNSFGHSDNVIYGRLNAFLGTPSFQVLVQHKHNHINPITVILQHPEIFRHEIAALSTFIAINHVL